jgi:hypothetical protein
MNWWFVQQINEVSMKLGEAWKYGFCDGLFNRECASPWKEFPANEKYVAGYMDGQAANRKVGLDREYVKAFE